MKTTIKESFLKKMIGQREFFIITLVVLMYIIVSVIKPTFIGLPNQLALLIGIANLLIICVGMTPLMIAGCFDMSVGSILGLAGGIASLAALEGCPLIVCILIAVIAGAVMGTFNGVCTSVFGMPAFVVTLATKNMFRGLLFAITKGVTIVKLPDNYTMIGQGKIFGLQYPIIISIILVIIGIVLLKKLRFFRQCFYIGGNEKAAILSGIRVKRTKVLLYTITGALAGFAGLITSARYGSSSTNMGDGLELTAITAIVVGGASMSGGSGSMVGMFFGAILMTAITNIMNLFGADIYWQTFIEGLTLFGAICLDTVTKSSKKKAARKEAEALLRQHR